MIPSRLRALGATLSLAMAVLVAAACSNAGEDFGFAPNVRGVVGAFVYLDRDGSLDPNTIDTVLADVKVALLASNGVDTVRSGVTDASGNVAFMDVPFGDYQMVVDPASVGDSVSVQAIDTAAVTLRANDPQQVVTIRVGYQAATITEARGLNPGTRVIVKGVMLTGIGIFGDTTAHFADAGGAIRLTQAKNAGPTTTAGDSVRVIGTVASRDGEVVLTDARVYLFAFAQNPPPQTDVTTQEAATADGGDLDAALVNLSAGGPIGSDTATVDGDYQFTVDDGSGPVLVVLDQDLPFPLAQFLPGKTLTGRGVLVPDGSGGWVLKPRAPTDVAAN